MTDLLPLPIDLFSWLDECGALSPFRENGDDGGAAIQAYARACVEHDRAATTGQPLARLIEAVWGKDSPEYAHAIAALGAAADLNRALELALELAAEGLKQASALSRLQNDMTAMGR